jgi:hypothetical protein
MWGEHHPGERIEVLTRPVTPIVCPMELLLRSDEHREQRHNLYAPDIAAAVVQARALFRAISPGKSSLISFRIMENGLIAHEAWKGDVR